MSTFTGCHLLFFCSAAAAAVADLAGWIFCKTTAPLVAKHGTDAPKYPDKCGLVELGQYLI